MQPDPNQFIHILGAILAFYAVLILVVLTAIIIPTWFICKKAGFSPWLAFLTLIPLGHLILLYVLAFADWKVVPAPQAYWSRSRRIRRNRRFHPKAERVVSASGVVAQKFVEEADNENAGPSTAVALPPQR